MCHQNSISCNHITTIHNHSIILRNITRYPITMHHEEIEVDLEVEGEIEEDLDEAEGQ
jgi:hypothetical protein